ncbi:acyl carrier protein [Dactylosporangium sp. NBC_01737]|uniref:acyl carrier protein n=1 Tax=Dactylosporangium sp. NBC_01737 TaxID=2975959 RepID=UPI002E13A845|nr:acyl carrier protein [Dactylosporangium sp. NBC_01737]
MTISSAPSTTPDQATIRGVVTRFLARYVDDTTLIDNERLITGGLLDSLAAVELIAQLERQFALTVDDEDLDIENFDSVAAIVAFVGRKVGT